MARTAKSDIERKSEVRKKDLARTCAEILAASGYTKTVRDTKHTFHVTDNDGNKADFVVKKASRPVLLTAEDAEAVISALVIAMREALKRGQKIIFHEFGQIKLVYRKERSSIHPVTKQRSIVPAHYYPRFVPGDAVRAAVKIYERSLDDELEPDELELDMEDFESMDLSLLLDGDLDEEVDDGEEDT